MKMTLKTSMKIMRISTSNFFSKFFLLFILICYTTVEAQEAKIDTIPKYSFSTVQEFWEQMEDIFDDPNFSNANWGVVLQSLVTGEYFYKRNEDKLFIPASNLKLFTSAAGLISLKPDFRYVTEIYSNGLLDGSILKGDLIIRGSGDPTISGRFYNEEVTKIFSNWADSLIYLGIDEIAGNIYGDDNVFDEKGLGNGWSWDYESYWYAAPSGALSFNDNCVDIFITPTKVGNKAQIRILPETKYSVIINNVTTNDSATNIEIYRERGTNIVTIFGNIKEGSETFKTYVTVSNPTQYFVVVLKDVLEKKGIKVRGFAIDGDELSVPIDLTENNLLFSHLSVPLRDIVKVINKNSQNFYSEQLLKTIGWLSSKNGSAAGGIKESKKYFTQMGINPENIVLADGSGLSRLNLVTPSQIISLLNYMYKSDYYTQFYNSLPIAGIDGTLANRMRKTRAINNVRAKTGFIGSVRSLSGYVYTGDKEPVAFSIIVNNFTVPLVLAENIQDLVCVRLANFKRK